MERQNGTGKKIARETGKNKSLTSEVKTYILGAKRGGGGGGINLLEEEAPAQKKLCLDSTKLLNELQERSAVFARQHRREP